MQRNGKISICWLNSQFTIVGEISKINLSQGKWLFITLKDAYSTVEILVLRFNCPVGKPWKRDDGQCFGGCGYSSKKAVSFQFIAEQIAPAGEGSLRIAFEKLRAQLDAEASLTHSDQTYPSRAFHTISALITAKDHKHIMTLRKSYRIAFEGLHVFFFLHQCKALRHQRVDWCHNIRSKKPPQQMHSWYVGGIIGGPTKPLMMSGMLSERFLPVLFQRSLGWAMGWYFTCRFSCRHACINTIKCCWNFVQSAKHSLMKYRHISVILNPCSPRSSQANSTLLIKPFPILTTHFKTYITTIYHTITHFLTFCSTFFRPNNPICATSESCRTKTLSFTFTCLWRAINTTYTTWTAAHILDHTQVLKEATTHNLFGFCTILTSAKHKKFRSNRNNAVRWYNILTCYPKNRKTPMSNSKTQINLRPISK